MISKSLKDKLAYIDERGHSWELDISPGEFCSCGAPLVKVDSIERVYRKLKKRGNGLPARGYDAVFREVEVDASLVKRSRSLEKKRKR